MKKNNNRFLKRWPIFFFDMAHKVLCSLLTGAPVYKELSGSSVQHILDGIRHDVKQARVYVIASLPELPREWFGNPSQIIFAERSATYESNGRTIHVKRAASWTGEADTREAIAGYAMADAAFTTRNGFGLLATAGTTGAYLLEQMLPDAFKDESAGAIPDDDFLRHLHAHTTQNRVEHFLPCDVDAFYHYDRRFAYAADCYLDLPCGQVCYSADTHYEKYETAFYDVSFQVPNGWQHIGLLPELSERGYYWPTKPGQYQGLCIAEPELRIAYNAGWPIEVHRKYLFKKARPLEAWKKRLCEMRDAALADNHQVEAGIYKAVLHQTIGKLYARSYTRERVVTREQFTQGDFADGDFEAGGVRISETVANDRRFYMPHWSAYVWSRARAAILKQALSMNYSDLIGFNADALYTALPLPGLADNGLPGQFRLKGQWERKQGQADVTLRTDADVRRMREIADKCFGGDGGLQLG